MSALNLLFWAFLAITRGQPGTTQYIQRQWLVTDDNLLYDDSDGPSLAVGMWPESSTKVAELVTMEDQNLLTTPEPHLVKEQKSNDTEESAVWKIVLVVAALLVSIAGSLSVAYYLCIWRGGRIYYQPQKESDP